MRKHGSFCIIFLLAGGAGFAAGIPDLRPPEGLIGPTLWEQYGGRIIFGLVAAATVLVLVVWRFRRSKPVDVPSPATIARNALEALRARPEDPALTSGVSRVVREYLRNVLDLPPQELTVDEWTATLALRPLPSAELNRKALEFLRDYETRIFAPQAPASGEPIAARGLQLVNAIELARPPATAAATASPLGPTPATP